MYAAQGLTPNRQSVVVAFIYSESPDTEGVAHVPLFGNQVVDNMIVETHSVGPLAMLSRIDAESIRRVARAFMKESKQ